MSRFGRVVILALSLALASAGAPPAWGADNFEAGVAPGVGGAWTVVNLQNAYSSPVVVCTVNYVNNVLPVVARVRNATASSFEVRLQNPSGAAVAADAVHYLAIEEGAWELPDGRPLEARRVRSTGTNFLNDWSLATATEFSYRQSYARPVVLGQVLTANDAAWSTFWSRAGSDRRTAPSASSCYVGKHVGEDAVTTRAAETLGVVVIDQGQGLLNGVRYETRLGAQAVQAIGDNPPYPYALGFSADPLVGVATVAGMNGGNGAWAYLFGASPLTAATLELAVDEDQIGDAERRHSSAERVAWLVFAQAASAELTPVVSWPYETGFEPNDYAPGALDNQDDWETLNAADVQTAPVHTGGQAAALTSMSAALRTFGGSPANATFWVEAVWRAEPIDYYPYAGYLREATCGVIEHATGGISGFAGDGAGGGAWRATGVRGAAAQPSAWTRISLRQDYARQSWDLFVNGNRLLAGLGFLHARDRLAGIEAQAGQNGTLFVDDIRVGHGDPATPIFELSVAAVDFGDTVAPRETTATLTITNLGVGMQQFDGALRGADAGVFGVVSGLPHTALGPAAAHSVTLRFAPTEAGDYTAVLDIVVSEGGRSTTFSVVLSGTAVEYKATAGKAWQMY